MGYSVKLFNWNFKTFDRLGFLDEKKRFLVYIIIAIQILTVIPAAYSIYMNWTDLGEAIYHLFMFSLETSVVVRTIAIFVYQRNIFNLYEMIDECHNELQQDGDTDSWENLQKYTKSVCRYSKMACYSVTICVVIVDIQPIVTSYGNFVIEVAVPGIDLHESPFYEIVYGFQAFLALPLAAMTYVPHIDTFLISTSFGIFMLKELRTKLENLSSMDESVAEVMLKKYIATHSKIIKYRDDLEEIFTIVNFCDVSLYCLAICLMLVYSSMDFNYALIIKGLQALILQTFLIFLVFYFGHMFSDESRNIAHAAYNTDWMNRSVEFQRYILLIITRSQRPLQLTAAGLKPLTMEFFLAILRTSYSFFSFVQSAM